MRKTKTKTKINMMEVFQSVRRTVKTGKGGAQEPVKGKGSHYHQERAKRESRNEKY